MITYSGRQVWQDTDIAPSLSDVGRSLGRLARWAGHTDVHYSVLAHTLTVAQIMPEQHWALHGLLDDAAEAVVGDVPTPWKPDAILDMETEIMGRIYAEHRLGVLTEEQQNAVHKADKRALVAEAYVLGHHDWQSIAKHEGFDPDDAAVAVTRASLELVPTLLHGPTAEEVFTSAFAYYRELADGVS